MVYAKAWVHNVRLKSIKENQSMCFDYVENIVCIDFLT